MKVEKKQRPKGIVSQKQEGYFTIRVVGRSGIFKSEEMILLSNIAKEYGNEELSLTSRLTIEIPYIKENNLDEVVKIIKENNLIIDCGGYTVRNVISCKGSVCKNGLIDTHKMANEIQDKFFGMQLPNKFKIGVFGCKNGAGRAEASDLGILPIRNVKIDKEKCVSCGICMKKCLEGAIVNDEGIYKIDYQKCIKCGRCVNFCSVGAVEGDSVEIQLYMGGRKGKEASDAIKLHKTFKEDEVVDVVDGIINYFAENALPKERFANMIERITFENVEKEVLHI